MDPLGWSLEWDLFFLGMAKYVARKSKDPVTKVGAVIVRPDKTVASIGFNGFPKGMDDHPDLYKERDAKLTKVIHAEMNAREFAGESVKGCTIYVWPYMPCARCAVHLIQAGIQRFVFAQATQEERERSAARFLETMSFIDEAERDRDEIPLALLEGL